MARGLQAENTVCTHEQYLYSWSCADWKKTIFNNKAVTAKAIGIHTHFLSLNPRESHVSYNVCENLNLLALKL